MASGTHQTQIEREARGYRWFWSFPPAMAIVTAPPEYPRTFTTQEQPFHPKSFLWAGVSPMPAAASPPLFGNRIMTTQEQPAYASGYSFVRASVPPHFVVPTGNLVKGYIL